MKILFKKSTNWHHQSTKHLSGIQSLFYPELGVSTKVTFSADNKKILVTNAPKTGQLKNSKYCNVCPTVHFSLANCFNKVNLISFDSHHDLRVTAQNIKNTFKVS